MDATDGIDRPATTLAAGRVGLAFQGLDAALIVVLGVIIVLVKQATVHHRRPMV